MSPALILARLTGSDWYGIRMSIPSAAASAPSSSGAVDAPVHTSTVKWPPRACISAMRRASAPGTAFGYPAPVNPLMPIVDPEVISAAASSADITFLAKTFE
jgi:hypothetical protein